MPVFLQQGLAGHIGKVEVPGCSKPVFQNLRHFEYSNSRQRKGLMMFDNESISDNGGSPAPDQNGGGVVSGDGQAGALDAKIAQINGQLTEDLRRNNRNAYDSLLAEKENLYQQRYPASADEMESKGQELMATPGYADGSLKNSNPTAYRKLQAEITACFNQADQLRRAEANSAESVQAQTQAETETRWKIQVLQDVHKELAELRQLGFECKGLPNEICDFHADGWKQQRLTAQRNWPELHESVLHTMDAMQQPAEVKKMFSGFMQADDALFDGDLKEKIAENVVRWLFNQRESAHKNKLKK